MTAPRWDTSRDRTQVWQAGLTTGDIHLQLHRGELTPDDWVRPSGGGNWQQLAMADAFVDVVVPPRRNQSQLPADEELDMTPMIDMTFLLLIFFMVTASFHMQKGFHFPPESSHAETQPVDKPVPGLAQVKDRLVLWVHADDSVHFDDGKGAPRPDAIPLAQLVATLSKESQDRKVDRLLVIPDEMAAHETLVTVIDSAIQARLTDVALADIVAGTAPRGTGGAKPAGGSSPAPKILRKSGGS
ncbi:MAG: biopolymer transporter ExbD [Pirellulales bacterium]